MFLRKIIITLFFIFQGNVATTIGISSVYLKYTLLFLSIFLILKEKELRKSITGSIFLLFIILLIFRYSTGIFEDSFQISSNLVLPCLIVAALPNRIQSNNKSLYIWAFKLLCCFFVLEVIIAVYESITHTHLLTWIDISYESHLNSIQNRPIGLAGSPLSNAQIMACLSFFILDTPLKNKYKYCLWGINFIGILLYQGRMSIVSSLLYFVFYMLIGERNSKSKFLNIIGIFIIMGSFVAVMFAMGLGSRLFISDDGGSAEMRMKAFAFFNIYSWKDYLLGSPYANVEVVRESLNVKIIEISVLGHIILFGIIFTLAFYYLYAKLYFQIYENRQKLLKTGTLLIFFALLNTSIGWFSGYSIVSFFLIYSKLFNEGNFRKLVPQKYLIKSR